MNVLVGIDALLHYNDVEKLFCDVIQKFKNNIDIKNLHVYVKNSDVLGHPANIIEKKLGIKINNIPGSFKKGEGYMNYSLVLVFGTGSLQELTKGDININPNNIFHFLTQLPGNENPYVIKDVSNPQKCNIRFISLNSDIQNYLLNDLDIISFVYSDPNSILNLIHK